MNRELYIDVRASEIVIALLEDKQLVELYREPNNSQFSVGDIYLGKVKKIMPGLNAAFVDVGYERDAFLHYLDLGPQFQSLNDYVQQAQSGKTTTALLDNTTLKPDIDKAGKIADVLKAGQNIVVQIAKEPISTKGPRLTSEISLAGRYLVLIPFSDKVSVSQKISSKEERRRLKRTITTIKPQNFGVIVRTVAKEKRVSVLEADMKYLIERWQQSVQTLKQATPPKLIIGEINRTSAMLRDILNASFQKVYVNNEDIYNEIRSFITTIAPESEKIVKLYNNASPMFDQFGIDKQIKGLFGKTVNMKNGSYLIIEHTEALHVIDVNSGNRAKTSQDQETNALDVNLMAAAEIARQLRMRDMGGIIVVDFIDMQLAENRTKVYQKMKECMDSDRTKHNILPLSKFGIMQITRQRVRPETSVENTEMCPSCNGTGQITSSTLVIDDIENSLKYIVDELKLRRIALRVHPYIEAFIMRGFISRRLKWQWKYKTRLTVHADSSYSLLEFHFFDRSDEEIII